MLPTENMAYPPRQVPGGAARSSPLDSSSGGLPGPPHWQAQSRPPAACHPFVTWKKGAQRKTATALVS